MPYPLQHPLHDIAWVSIAIWDPEISEPDLGAQPSISSMPGSEAVLAAFKRFDSDVSGAISRDELAEAHWLSRALRNSSLAFCCSQKT